ncbi:MAG: HEAT repeat domain-containing protein [Firmicutes bacterium]|nr:HEAT repeat domain-containing protein [Bacillota bacterium]
MKKKWNTLTRHSATEFDPAEIVTREDFHRLAQDTVRDLEMKTSTMTPSGFICYVFDNWNHLYYYFVENYLKDRVGRLTPEEVRFISDKLAEQVCAQDYSPRLAAAVYFRYIYPEDLSALEALSHDTDPVVRCEALESLVKIKGASAREKAVELFNTDKDSLVRLVALKQLASMQEFNFTDIFMAALESDSAAIYSEGCKYLAEKKNRKVYMFLRRKYIRARDHFDRLCLSHALFLHGERNKLEKILSVFNLPGDENCKLRYEASIFLDRISWVSSNKIRKFILPGLKEALLKEDNQKVAQNINETIKNMELDIAKGIPDRRIKGQKEKLYFCGQECR